MGKFYIYLGIFIFGSLGSYLPVLLFHVSYFSVISIIGSVVGGIFGIWIGYKFSQNYS